MYLLIIVYSERQYFHAFLDSLHETLASEYVPILVQKNLDIDTLRLGLEIEIEVRLEP